MSRKPSASDNHSKAPEAAKFVRLMREFFGEDVRVLYVKEGDFEMGRRTDATA